MLLQTSGCIDTGDLPSPSYPLGPWCSQSNDPPCETSLNLPCNSDLDVQEFSEVFIRDLESALYPALNKFHGVELTEDAWKFSVGTYLRVLTPLLVTRYNLVRRTIEQRNCAEFTFLGVKDELVIPSDRSQLQVLINSHLWNQFVLERICLELGLKPLKTALLVTPRTSNQRHMTYTNQDRTNSARKCAQKILNAIARRRKSVVIQTMLPSLVEFNVALSTLSVPMFWHGDAPYSTAIDDAARGIILKQVESSDNIHMLFREIVIRTLPKLFVEDFNHIRMRTKSLFPKQPSLVFTSNLHMASDQFLLWLSEARGAKTRVMIGQHGGVHCLARDLPVEASIEFELADRYLAWGEFASQVPRGVKSPALVTRGKNLQRASRRNSILMILDSPYRYPSMPRGLNANRFQYSAMLNTLLTKEFLNLAQQIIIRQYAGAERFDDSLLELLTTDPKICLDDGTQPIDNLLKESRLVITTSLGTTPFRTIQNNIPTMLLLDPMFSPLSSWAEEEFNRLRSASMLFSDPLDLLNHFRTVSIDIDQWWNSPETQQARQDFVDLFHTQPYEKSAFYIRQIRSMGNSSTS